LACNVKNRNVRRVVITGRGVISPAGCTPVDFWEGITCGRSAIGMATRFDTSELAVHTAGEVDLEPFARLVPRATLQRPDLSIRLGLLAAKWALEDASLVDEAKGGMRIGAYCGSGTGPCDATAIGYKAYYENGARAVRPTSVPRCMYNGLASEISIAFHLTGSHHVIAAACASASLAMGVAYDAIAHGREEVILTGGADSPLTRSMYVAWANLRVLANEPDPALAMRPFDNKRNGFVLAEGACMLVFEELQHALARNATIYAEVLGHGASSDATHITKPDVDGQVAALRQALCMANLKPEDVDYINAHGTSTVLNDLTETQAIKAAFGDHARRIGISSTKSVLGHTMGASGAMELLATSLAIEKQVMPPTVNLTEADPACDLDYVPNEARPAAIRIALSNSFAFGGSNSVIAVRRYEENDHG